MERVARKLNIKKPEDWGKYAVEQIVSSGGSGVLSTYNNSLLKALKSIFPGNFDNSIESWN